jgi:hypothetical protein
VFEELEELLDLTAIKPTPNPPTAPASTPNKTSMIVLSTNVSLPALHMESPLIKPSRFYRLSWFRQDHECFAWT